MSEWIRVDEELPKVLQAVKGKVLGGETVRCIHYMNGTFNAKALITHWMPLPEPPVE